MNSKDIPLNETSQSQKDKHHKFHLCEVLRAVKCAETETRVVVAGGLGEGEMGSPVHG